MNVIQTRRGRADRILVLPLLLLVAPFLSLQADAFDPQVDQHQTGAKYSPLHQINRSNAADLELAWEPKDVVEILFDDCEGFDKKEASPTLVFKALTYDGVEVASTPVDDPGIDQVWRQK